MRHIILCLNCISTTTSCDRGEDFRPYRRRLPARSRGCRRSWNASRQDHPESTYEAQITPARRVGARSGAHLSSPRAITLRTTHVPGIVATDLLSSPAKWHHRNRGSPLEGGSCPNRTQRTPTTFHRATRTAESCGFVKRAQRLQPPLSPIWTLPTTPRPSARPEPHGRSHSPTSLLPHSPRSGRDAPCCTADPPCSTADILLSGCPDMS